MISLEKVTSQVGKWFTGREPDKCWTRQRYIQHRREQTEKARRGFTVWSIDGPLGDLTRTGDQPSGKVVLVREAGQATETTSTESEQPEEDTQGCSGWSNGYR